MSTPLPRTRHRFFAERSLPLGSTVLLAAVTLLSAGCSAWSTAPRAPARAVLRVTGAYLPQPAMGDMAAGYFTIANTGQGDDQLTSVSSDAASTVTMHTTNASGEMLPVASFDIPARSALVLHTGGNHLMLTGLTRKPTVGQTVHFTLRFARSAPVTVAAPVEPMGYQSPN